MNGYSTFWGSSKRFRFLAFALASALRHLDLDFKHFKAILSFKIDFDVFGIDFDVLRNHCDQFALQRWQVVWRCAMPTTLVGQNNLQALFGNVGGIFLLAKGK